MSSSSNIPQLTKLKPTLGTRVSVYYVASLRIPQQISTDTSDNVTQTLHLHPKKMRAFTNGTTYSPMHFQFLLEMWCAHCHQPFKIVLDPELGAIFQMLYDCVDIPHPMTVSHDVSQIYNISKEQVTNVLQVS